MARRPTSEMPRATIIAALNDKFRKGLPASGRVYVTAGVNAKGGNFVSKALARVVAFDDFNADTDPHGEHDFGSFDLDGERLLFKIDYYSLSGQFGSEDPADLKKTLRVLTVILAEEY